ncbi:MAG TPA: adenylate/guanylate cyclase domain-containing protein [Spirochaetia bacterium]|nr:adenylate/guanylate cyclase domain-containing protein [Spirochaetia bacterium]
MNRKSGLRALDATVAGIATVVAVALLLATGLSEGGGPPAVEGRVRYESGTRALLLGGSWERYGGFVTDQDLAAEPRRPSFAASPLTPSILPGPAPEGGPVTYRMRVELPLRGGRYSLFVPGLPGFRALLVDGKFLYDSSAGASPPRELSFEAQGPEVSILLQSGEGGPRLEAPGLLPGYVLFGEAKGLQVQRLVAAGLPAIGVGCFAVAALFFFLLFAFWRANREFLAFSLFSLAAAFVALVSNAGILGLASPSAPAVERAYLAGLAALALAFFWFLSSAFPKRLPLWAKAAFSVPPLLLAAAALLPLASASLAELPLLGPRPLYAAVFGLCALYCLAAFAWNLVLAAKGERRALWLLSGLAIAAAGAAARRAAPAGFNAAYFAEPLGFAAFAFVAALMLVKRMGDGVESLAILTDYAADVSATVKRFIPKEFLDYLSKAEITDLRLGDHVKKEMTIFFSDIRAFTELSERLTIEENFAFINSYLARVVPLITERGGFIDKYIGDAIMAPFPGDTGPDAAIRAAVAMQEKVVEYNGHRAKMGYRPISMGVGIHTGDLMLGVVGVSDRMENTVISDAVNLASRLQAITKAFNIGLAISEQSFKELEDPGSYKYRFIGKVKVKGKAAPVSVFEIFDGIAPALFERKMKVNTFFEQGMLSYYQKDFAGAMYYFKRVLDTVPEDGAAAFYLENCMAKAAL